MWIMMKLNEALSTMKFCNNTWAISSQNNTCNRDPIACLWVAKKVASHYLNTLRPRQKGRHFADNIFKCIFFSGYVWISLKISLRFVPNGPINNIPALVQIIAWRRPDDKPLSEPMVVGLLMHICVTRPQWVNQWWCSSVIYKYKELDEF